MVGKNIRSLREELGFTQSQVSTYLGVTPSAVAQYESESRSVSTQVISKLALLFNVDEFSFYEENPQKQSLASAFAFKAGDLNDEDLDSICKFRKIVNNYFNLLDALEDEGIRVS